MKVLAKTIKGQEYMYNARSARQVSERSAKVILDIVNEYRFLLNNENEIWHVYDVDRYDRAYDYAQFQKFTIRNGIVKSVNL